MENIRLQKIAMEKVDYDLGYTIVYYPWDDMECKPKVAGRFKTAKEKDEFLEKIHKPDSGWLEEELNTIMIVHDYYYQFYIPIFYLDK